MRVISCIENDRDNNVYVKLINSIIADDCFKVTQIKLKTKLTPRLLLKDFC